LNGRVKFCIFESNKSNLMKTKFFLLVICVFSTLYINVVFGQVGINNDGSNPDTSAILDVKSTSKGFLIPE